MKRKSPRLPEYDYSSEGAYFVTLCTKDKKHVFGKVDGVMEYSNDAETVKKIWEALPNHYRNIKLDDFVIMPNHIHCILWVLDKKEITVEEGLRPSPTKVNKNHGMPEIIRALKSFSAREINKVNGTAGEAFWQRSFFEHIIRDEDDLNNHRNYIRANPLKWALDEYFNE